MSVRGRGNGTGPGSPPVLRHRSASLELASGGVLTDVVQAYTLLGELSPRRDNLVILFHSLTGTLDPRRWWPGVVGPGGAVDTDRWAVLTPNLLGSCYGTTRPPEHLRITPRDMAALVRALVRDLGVETVALATGGSLGGMVALEWAASFPDLTRNVVVMAAPAAHTAQAIGFNHVQRRAIELAGVDGLAVARMAAMLNYRTDGELTERFGRERREDGVFQIQSYLSHQGEKLVGRFDRRAYLTLIDAMDAHDVGAGRGGVGEALGAFRGRLVGLGIPGDLLYPPEHVRAWTEAGGGEYREVPSPHGHDGFLLERDEVGRILGDVLAGEAVSRR